MHLHRGSVYRSVCAWLRYCRQAHHVNDGVVIACTFARCAYSSKPPSWAISKSSSHAQGLRFRQASARPLLTPTHICSSAWPEHPLPLAHHARTRTQAIHASRQSAQEDTLDAVVAHASRSILGSEESDLDKDASGGVRGRDGAAASHCNNSKCTLSSVRTSSQRRRPNLANVSVLQQTRSEDTECSFGAALHPERIRFCGDTDDVDLLVGCPAGITTRPGSSASHQMNAHDTDGSHVENIRSCPQRYVPQPHSRAYLHTHARADHTGTQHAGQDALDKGKHNKSNTGNNGSLQSEMPRVSGIALPTHELPFPSKSTTVGNTTRNVSFSLDDGMAMAMDAEGSGPIAPLRAAQIRGARALLSARTDGTEAEAADRLSTKQPLKPCALASDVPCAGKKAKSSGVGENARSSRGHCTSHSGEDVVREDNPDAHAKYRHRRHKKQIKFNMEFGEAIHHPCRVQGGCHATHAPSCHVGGAAAESDCPYLTYPVVSCVAQLRAGSCTNALLGYCPWHHGAREQHRGKEMLAESLLFGEYADAREEGTGGETNDMHDRVHDGARRVGRLLQLFIDCVCEELLETAPAIAPLDSKEGDDQDTESPAPPPESESARRNECPQAGVCKPIGSRSDVWARLRAALTRAPSAVTRSESFLSLVPVTASRADDGEARRTSQNRDCGDPVGGCGKHSIVYLLAIPCSVAECAIAAESHDETTRLALHDDGGSAIRTSKSPAAPAGVSRAMAASTSLHVPRTDVDEFYRLWDAEEANAGDGHRATKEEAMCVIASRDRNSNSKDGHGAGRKSLLLDGHNDTDDGTDSHAGGGGGGVSKSQTARTDYRAHTTLTSMCGLYSSFVVIHNHPTLCGGGGGGESMLCLSSLLTSFILDRAAVSVMTASTTTTARATMRADAVGDPCAKEKDRCVSLPSATTCQAGDSVDEWSLFSAAAAVVLQQRVRDCDRFIQLAQSYSPPPTAAAAADADADADADAAARRTDAVGDEKEDMWGVRAGWLSYAPLLLLRDAILLSRLGTAEMRESNGYGEVEEDGCTALNQHVQHRQHSGDFLLQLLTNIFPRNGTEAKERRGTDDRQSSSATSPDSSAFASATSHDGADANTLGNRMVGVNRSSATLREVSHALQHAWFALHTLLTRAAHGLLLVRGSGGAGCATGATTPTAARGVATAMMTGQQLMQLTQSALIALTRRGSAALARRYERPLRQAAGWREWSSAQLFDAWQAEGFYGPARYAQHYAPMLAAAVENGLLQTFTALVLSHAERVGESCEVGGNACDAMRTRQVASDALHRTALSHVVPGLSASQRDPAFAQATARRDGGRQQQQQQQQRCGGSNTAQSVSPSSLLGQRDASNRGRYGAESVALGRTWCRGYLHLSAGFLRALHALCARQDQTRRMLRDEYAQRRSAHTTDQVGHAVHTPGRQYLLQHGSRSSEGGSSRMCRERGLYRRHAAHDKPCRGPRTPNQSRSRYDSDTAMSSRTSSWHTTAAAAAAADELLGCVGEESVAALDVWLPHGSVVVSPAITVSLLRLMLDGFGAGNGPQPYQALELAARVVRTARVLRQAALQPRPFLAPGTRRVHTRVWSHKRGRKVLVVRHVPMMRVVQPQRRGTSTTATGCTHDTPICARQATSSSSSSSSSSSNFDANLANKNTTSVLLYGISEALVVEVLRVALRMGEAGRRLAEGVWCDCLAGRLYDISHSRALPLPHDFAVVAAAAAAVVVIGGGGGGGMGTRTTIPCSSFLAAANSHASHGRPNLSSSGVKGGPEETCFVKPVAYLLGLAATGSQPHSGDNRREGSAHRIAPTPALLEVAWTHVHANPLPLPASPQAGCWSGSRTHDCQNEDAVETGRKEEEEEEEKGGGDGCEALWRARVSHFARPPLLFVRQLRRMMQITAYRFHRDEMSRKCARGGGLDHGRTRRTSWCAIRDVNRLWRWVVCDPGSEIARRAEAAVWALAVDGMAYQRNGEDHSSGVPTNRVGALDPANLQPTEQHTKGDEHKKVVDRTASHGSRAVLLSSSHPFPRRRNAVQFLLSALWRSIHEEEEEEKEAQGDADTDEAEERERWEGDGAGRCRTRPRPAALTVADVKKQLAMRAGDERRGGECEDSRGGQHEHGTHHRSGRSSFSSYTSSYRYSSYAAELIGCCSSPVQSDMVSQVRALWSVSAATLMGLSGSSFSSSSSLSSSPDSSSAGCAFGRVDVGAAPASLALRHVVLASFLPTLVLTTPARAMRQYSPSQQGALCSSGSSGGVGSEGGGGSSLPWSWLDVNEGDLEPMSAELLGGTVKALLLSPLMCDESASYVAESPSGCGPAKHGRMGDRFDQRRTNGYRVGAASHVDPSSSQRIAQLLSSSYRPVVCSLRFFLSLQLLLWHSLNRAAESHQRSRDETRAAAAAEHAGVVGQHAPAQHHAMIAALGAQLLDTNGCDGQQSVTMRSTRRTPWSTASFLPKMNRREEDEADGAVEEDTVTVAMLKSSSAWKLYESLLAHPPLARLWLHFTLIQPSASLLRWLDVHVVTQRLETKGNGGEHAHSERSILRLWQCHVEC